MDASEGEHLAEPRAEVHVRAGAAAPACLLALLVPGAGHLYLGRRDKGLVFLVAIGALWSLGVLMGAPLQINLGFDDLLATGFTVAQWMVGLPYLIARQLVTELRGDTVAVTFEYAKTFTAVAGLLNVLVILDAYDTAVGRKR
jgi:hypothetical protein